MEAVHIQVCLWMLVWFIGSGAHLAACRCIACSRALVGAPAATCDRSSAALTVHLRPSLRALSPGVPCHAVPAAQPIVIVWRCLQPADLKDMAKCCKDLSHFGAEGSAVKGYIAMMPLFRNAPARQAQPPWLPGSSQKEARTYALQQKLSDLVDTIIHEKAVFSLVFSTWKVRRGPKPAAHASLLSPACIAITGLTRPFDRVCCMTRRLAVCFACGGTSRDSPTHPALSLCTDSFLHCVASPFHSFVTSLCTRVMHTLAPRSTQQAHAFTCIHNAPVCPEPLLLRRSSWWWTRGTGGPLAMGPLKRRPSAHCRSAWPT